MSLKITPPQRLKGLAIAALAAAGVLFSCSKSPSVETSSSIHVFDGPKASVSVSLRNAAPLTKTELQTVQEKAISSLDVFVFRDGLLEAHGRSTGATVTGLEVTHGEKTIWAFVNYSVERMNAVTSLATATSFATQYAENGRSAFCMRGYDTFTVSSSATSFNMDVRRDVSKVEIAAAPQFTGLAAGGTLEGIYLINIPKVYSNSAVSTSSSDSWNFDNAVATAVDPQVSALSSATGASSWQTALYGMPNTTAEAATVDAKDYVTKLVLKATVQGQSYWYPIGIPDMGANKLYSISNISIRRIGADNPNDYISAEDVDITINVLDWDEGTVDGSYNGGVIYDPVAEAAKMISRMYANGHDFADLGFRFGDKKILFATCNFGASSPEQSGDYFAWGETSKKYMSISENTIIGGEPFDWAHTPYHTGSSYNTGWNKYIPLEKASYASSGIADNIMNLEPCDDIAQIEWGTNWQIPSEWALSYLASDFVQREWTDNYKGTGAKGYIIRGKEDFSSQEIFLPVTGYCSSTSRSIPDNGYSLYMSSTLTEDAYCFSNLTITNSNISINNCNRCMGTVIRPVLVVPDPDYTPPTFSGLQISRGPLYYNGSEYEVKEQWEINSFERVYGKNAGSTCFSFIEMGQLFENPDFSASDGDIDNILDPFDGWRVPSSSEWLDITINTSSRAGSIVNNNENCHYALIEIEIEDFTYVDADANEQSLSGILLFPDNRVIYGCNLTGGFDNNRISRSVKKYKIDNYIKQGCMFFPGTSAFSNINWSTGRPDYMWGKYISSTEGTSSNAAYFWNFNLSYFSINTSLNPKATYYVPVRLVK